MGDEVGVGRYEAGVVHAFSDSYLAIFDSLLSFAPLLLSVSGLET